MAVGVEVGKVRLPLRLEQRGRPLQESHAEFVRAGLDGDSQIQILVNSRIIGGCGSLPLPGGFDTEQFQPPSIHREFHLVGFSKPFDVLVAIARQTDRDVARDFVGRPIAARLIFSAAET